MKGKRKKEKKQKQKTESEIQGLQNINTKIINGQTW